MSALRTNLSFDLNEENDITAIRDSDTGSVVYTVKTSGCVGGALATTFARRNQLDGSTRSAFKILWKGGKESLKDVMIVLEDRTSEEIPAGELLERAQGRNTYGFVNINDVEYRWKSKGTGPRMVLVNKETNATVAESQSRRWSGFKQARGMSLEISGAVSFAMDIVLLTFVLAWSERQSERSKNKPPTLNRLPKSTLEMLEGCSIVVNPGTRRQTVPLFLIPPFVLSYRYRQM